jgi:hypothetical protein
MASRLVDDVEDRLAQIRGRELCGTEEEAAATEDVVAIDGAVHAEDVCVVEEPRRLRARVRRLQGDTRWSRIAKSTRSRTAK